MGIYQQTYSILGSDMDITYHITPNAILLYFQDCFARFLSSRKLAAFDIVKQNLLWVISDLEMNFVGERPLWSSDIRVKIRFNEIAAVRIYVDYWVCNDRDEVFAQGTSTWVLMNSLTRRPVAVKEVLEKGGIEASGEPRIDRSYTLPAEKELLKEIEHQVNITDLDFNGHVCNRTYLMIALGTLSLDFIQTYSPKHIHIQFIREAFFGEILNCRVYQGEGQSQWYEIVNSKNKNVCRLYAEWEDQWELLSKDVSDQIQRR